MTTVTVPSAIEIYDEVMALITGLVMLAIPIVLAAPVVAVVAVVAALVLGVVAVGLGAVVGVPLLAQWGVRKLLSRRRRRPQLARHPRQLGAQAQA